MYQIFLRVRNVSESVLNPLIVPFQYLLDSKLFADLLSHEFGYRSYTRAARSNARLNPVSNTLFRTTRQRDAAGVLLNSGYWAGLARFALYSNGCVMFRFIRT